MFDHAIAPFDRLAALDRLAVVEHWPGREIAVAVGVRLEQLGRKAVGEIREYVLPRSEVHLDIAPFLGGDLRQAPFHQGFAGGDDLDNGGVAGLEIALDRTDQRRRFHRGEQMSEKALFH
jgi:hypothetical protein